MMTSLIYQYNIDHYSVYTVAYKQILLDIGYTVSRCLTEIRIYICRLSDEGYVKGIKSV